MARTVAVLLAAYLATATGPAAAQSPERARIAADLREYHALIAAWRGGDDSVVQHLLTMRRERVFAVIANSQGPLDSVRPWEGSRFEAAATMHADAALALTSPPDADGVFAQLEMGSRVLELGGAARRAFAERWYVTLAGVFVDRTWIPAAERVLKLGRQRLPGDAAVLCESGILAELMATDPAFEPDALRRLALNLAGPGRPLSPSAFNDVSRRRDFHLTRAHEWLDEAERIGPTDWCRVHLGRVLSLQGRYAESDRLLAQASGSADDGIAYLAAMFQGASAERLARLDQAEAHYRRAIARYARAQAAYFALSHVLLGTGRVAEARSVLRDVVAGQEDARREPWWWYFIAPTNVAAERLDDLRREARR